MRLFSRLSLTLSLLLLSCLGMSGKEKVYFVQSPSGAVRVEIRAGENLSWSVARDGKPVLSFSPLSMTLDDGSVFGGKDLPRKLSRRSEDASVATTVYHKAAVRDRYNELTLHFKDYKVLFRAYDDGAAYRFVSERRKPFKVTAETARFCFPEDREAYVPYTRKLKDNFECQFFTSFEALYERHPLSAWKEGRMAFLPLTADGPDGMKICITESDLLDYPGMYLSNEDHDSALEALFAPYPKTIVQGGHNRLQGLVESREDYIASMPGACRFPWRIVIVAAQDRDLLACDLPWLLGTPEDPSLDFSWIRPGKVAWDWWNAWNLFGVDFRAGINNDTYKYYIDFAADNGIEYVILDEGWAVNRKADLFQVVPEIDLEELVAYGRRRGVGLILWAGYWAFEKDMERVCREYSAMGIKGFKVDFMDRDDQPMVQFYTRAAETAARYHLLLDFHGAFKPSGLQRTWPNVINFEGVYGLENAKWGSAEDYDAVTYEVTIPFVRLVAGPADYTQGAMRNATRGNYRPVHSEAMSQGTRCRQLAEYVVFDAPLNMLCDSPSNYLQEPECLQCIAGIPTTWDETVALEGKIGEYVAIARRKGDVWYVGALTDWNARELTLDLSFVGEGRTMEIFRDGINADRAARDYRREFAALPSGGKVPVSMAPGGGWLAIIR